MKRAKIFTLACCLGLLFTACAEGDEDEASAILELMALGAGQKVADVGAGDGEWTEVLARQVGPNGAVWATEVEQDLVDDLRSHFDVFSVENEGLAPVEAVLGDQESLGLPADCCEAILLRLVYHHFQDPAPMRRDLLAALRSGGRLLVIDIEPQGHWGELEGVPDRGGHGIPLEELVADLTAAGFSEITRHHPWNDDEDRYAVLFSAP